jgi:vitamin B12/bleomycin/antimicrobial peptide transport system ATP-binding/permease protein
MVLLHGMAERSRLMSQTSAGVTEPYELSLSGQLRMMTSAFWNSPVRRQLVILSIALLVIIIATTYATYKLNEWNGPFYDALERRDMPEFLRQLTVFAVIAFSLTLLNVIQTWLNQITALKMREGLARDLADVWLTPGRALKLGGAGVIANNPDQRLHEDTRILAENTTALAIGLVNSTILLGSFIGVLWAISTEFVFTIAGRTIQIPGYMLWATILYAVIGSVLSNVVGSRLARLNADRYAREADLRAALVRANENLKPITLAGGEANELGRVHAGINGVLDMLRKLAWALTNLTWVSSGFGWLALVAPIIIASPMYFSGELTFGGLMMAVGAFNQVNTALRWYVANFSVIADWRATLARVSFFRNALIMTDTPAKEGEVIAYTRGKAEDGLHISGVEVYGEPDEGAAGHGIRLKEDICVVEPGGRVMINGDPGTDRHLFFQAVAGIWPWGRGEIRLPQSERMIMMPQEGYLPTATLREVMTYPSTGPASMPAVSDEALREALLAVGLDRYVDRLDHVERWDRLLDKEEEAALQVANAVLRKPDWLIMDDVLEGLEQETRERLIDVLTCLESSTLVYIGRSDEFAKAFKPETFHLAPLHPNGPTNHDEAPAEATESKDDTADNGGGRDKGKAP